jgi:hypothetical protein
MSLPKVEFPIYTMELLSNNKKIRFRPFLVKEQKLLLMATESQDNKDILDVVKQICKNCILDNIDVESLPVFDLEYIFLNLRSRSVNEVVELQYRCNNNIKDDSAGDKVCGNLEKFKVNLLEIRPTKQENHNPKIMFGDTLGVSMKYPTFDMIENLKGTTEEEILFELLTKCIDYVFDKDEVYYAKDYTQEELIDFIDNLQQKDLEKIQDFFDTAPKIKHNLNFKCRKCNYEENIVVEGLQNFFV